MKKCFNVRRDDRRHAQWARRNAALFHDRLEEQLLASLDELQQLSFSPLLEAIELSVWRDIKPRIHACREARRS
jgi:hypothetical protein